MTEIAARLAEARQDIAHRGTGYVPPWRGLTEDERQMSVREARNWVEALRVLGVDLVDAQHVIEFRADGWTIQHPLACRLNGQLFDCPVNQVAGVDLRALDGPPAPPGQYECDINDLGDRLLIGDRVDG